MARVIESSGLSKRFLLRHNRSGSLKERFLGLLHASRREQVEEFWALRDVTLAVNSGEAVGIVGRNGSGKSTFLRLVAGIHRPTEGSLAVRRGARIGTMIELGVGFHAELTGSENVFLNAAVHGLSRVEIEPLYGPIVEYSGLASFMDVPLKNYSSGMVIRLAFAVAANLDPDILLLDEIFAVGDESFQQQCIRTMQKFRADGKTILFVSHSSAAVRSICDRVCLLDHGRLLFDGEVARGLEEYQRVASERRTIGELEPSEPSAHHEGGWHRVVPGGHWAEGGDWAFSLLRSEGLKASEWVLEAGCGSLATGRHLLAFLDAGCYWGFEANQALLLAGVSIELPRMGLSYERGSFIINHDFDLSAIGHPVQFAISEGLFSRLPLNRIARCIAAVIKRLGPGGRFYATWFDNPDPLAFDPIDRGGFTTYADAEPFHYPFAILARICEALGAHAERVDGPFSGGSHPRGESLMVITPSP
jgi:ABC-type polysaccharide/polyol phosphate transport system ATPase subunit/SAM-dependent methyltransferase